MIEIGLIAVIATATVIGIMMMVEGIESFELIPIIFGIVTLAGSITGIIYICNLPHKDTCQCEYCYEKIGMINGVEIFDHENKLHYYDKPNKQYVEIIQEDGTPYTYQEFIENQLKEVEK